MPRRLRIDYPGAFFHITSRGNRKQAIFLSDDDRYYFLSCLREAHEKHSVLFHVYCLMENHYHLFLETLRGGLSKAMHHINMRYSNYFNLKHNHCGHTFQARFKAILVEAAVYARDLASYIHLNPVRAGIVCRPEDYVWSNYREFIGLAPAQGWSSSSFILSLFGSSPTEARANYAAFVLSRLDRSHPNPLKAAERTGILGGPEFIDRIKQTVAADDDPELKGAPEMRLKASLRPDFGRIVSETELVFGPRSRIKRNIAVYLSHAKTDYTLKEIGDFFGIGRSGVTDICRRLKKELINNEALLRTIDEIEARLRR